MNKRLYQLLFLALAIGCLSSVRAQEQESTELATVNGEVITVAQFMLLARSAKVSQENLPELVNHFLTSVVMAQLAEEDNLASNNDVKRALRVSEINVLANAYVAKLRSDIKVSDSEAEDRYETWKSERLKEKEFLSRHILLDDEEAAKKLLSEINGDGTKFKNATSESLDPGSKDKEGELGWAPASTYAPPFGAALSKLAKGEITAAPVQTQFGWHLIMLEDKRQAQIPELDDPLRLRIKESLVQEKIASILQEKMKTADVKITGAISDDS